MRTIQMKCGRSIMVDDEDFDRVSAKRWHSRKTRHKVIYAESYYFDAAGIRKKVKLHRFIMKPVGTDEIDHKDGDGLNCCRENLRILPDGRNNAAKKTKAAGKTSQYRGVCWIDRGYKTGGKWVASISKKTNGVVKAYRLGVYDSEHDAAHAWNNAAALLDFLPESFNKIQIANIT